MKMERGFRKIGLGSKVWQEGREDKMGSTQKEQVLQYIRDVYKVLPEYPWAGDPDDAVFKEKESGKWFAVLMYVSGRVLGLDCGEKVWVLNIKADPDFIMMISGTPGYLPGYHMNKKNWLTLLLDGTLSKEQIYGCIDRSFYRISDTPARRIYEAVKRIPQGKVATYGQVARMAGNPKMARAVGNALHRNPDPETIPCYRVVNAKGELSGEFAFGGAGIQAKLLSGDGIAVKDGRVDLAKYGLTPEEVTLLAEQK